jgi:hypothetical protein
MESLDNWLKDKETTEEYKLKVAKWYIGSSFIFFLLSGSREKQWDLGLEDLP